jgi:hypothetical protein
LRASFLANSAFASYLLAFFSFSSAVFLTLIFFFSRVSDIFNYLPLWKLSRAFSLALWRLTCALRAFWVSSSCKLPSIRWFLVALIVTEYSLRGEELKVSRILLLRLSSHRTHSLYKEGGFGRVGNWYSWIGAGAGMVNRAFSVFSVSDSVSDSDPNSRN